MDNFLSLVRFLQLNEFYLHLPIKEKHMMRKFGGYLSQEQMLWPNFSRASLLWVIAANAIPAGEGKFAKKLLYEALDMAQCPKDICYIHSNLAQIHQDENDTDYCNHHCREALATGYYNKWAVDTVVSNLMSAGKLTEAKEFCQSILTNDTYRNDQPKYRQILINIENQLKMPVQEHLLS